MSEKYEGNRNPLDQQIADVFERKANAAKARLIKSTYAEKFQQMVERLPAEQQDSIMVSLQKLGLSIKGFCAEYGARFTDFVRNIFIWPMVKAAPDFPKDKYYQIALARAAAWTGFAQNTRSTATKERTAYRDHFLPSTVIGAEFGSLFGTMWGIPAGIIIGGVKGAEAGAIAGAAGIAVGAGIGAAVGGLTSIIMKIKDRIIGPPVVYYNLDAYSGSGTTISSSSVSLGSANSSASRAS